MEFDNVVMRYRPQLPAVLKNVSFVVPGGASMGICGRTGSGKSSMVNALLRMVGDICICFSTFLIGVLIFLGSH